jgi:hypothetical protein
VNGRCMCGAVEFSVEGALRPVVNCHCHRCRRWSGHYWAASGAPTERVSISDSATLRWFSPADGVEYGFCSTCGSSLFWRNDAHPELISFSAGCLDQPTGLTTSHQLWMAEHGDYHEPLSAPEPREFE